MCVCVRVRVGVSVGVSVSVSVCLFVCLSVCLCVCVCRRVYGGGLGGVAPDMPQIIDGEESTRAACLRDLVMAAHLWYKTCGTAPNSCRSDFAWTVHWWERDLGSETPSRSPSTLQSLRYFQRSTLSVSWEPKQSIPGC